MNDLFEKLCMQMEILEKLRIKNTSNLKSSEKKKKKDIVVCINIHNLVTVYWSTQFELIGVV